MYIFLNKSGRTLAESIEDNKALLEPFTEEEVKRVIFDMKIDSAPIFLSTEHAGEL